MKHLRYLRYVLHHKWYVMLACFRRGLYWQGIIHDWSKFLPDEWFPYAEFFYGVTYSDAERDRAKRIGIYLPHPDEARTAFNFAWLKHQHRNPHHWQHWILREDSGKEYLMEMPKKYRLEMLCDWEGAGIAITGKREYDQWYLKNADKIRLHPATKAQVVCALGLEGVSMKSDELPNYSVTCPAK